MFNGFNSSPGPNPPPSHLAAMAARYYGWPEPVQNKAPDSADRRLVKQAFDIGKRIGREAVRTAEADAYYKRNLPQMLERAKQEFDQTEVELKRLETRSGLTCWGPDPQRQKRYEAVLERVSQRARRDAYRAVGA